MKSRLFEKYIIISVFILVIIFWLSGGYVFGSEIELPGRIERTGNYFELKDSGYFNIILESAEEIKVVLESIPRMINLDIEAITDGINSTTLTIEGLEPNKTYYKYQDSYKNETFFFSSDGNHTFIQDLIQPHHIWIEERTKPPFSSLTSSQNLTINSFSENPRELFTIPDEIKVTFMVGKEQWQPGTEFQIGEGIALMIETELLRAGNYSAIAKDTTFVISDERDNIIWTTSVGPIGEGWTCCPGGGWGAGVFWGQVDTAGNPVEPGIYKAGVVFTEPTFDFPEDFSGIIPLTIIDIRMPPPEGWSEDIRLTTYHTALSHPSIAIDANNNIHILWTDGRDAEEYWNLYYTKIDERGNKLINDKKITSSASYQFTENDRQIVADPQGNIHIVWRKDYAIGNAIYYMKLDNNGNVLIPDKFISSGAYPHLYYPSIVVDSNNNLHISINEWAEGTRYLELNNNGDVLIEKQSIGEHYGWWSGDPSIAVDLENNVYLTWFDTFNYETSIHFTKIDSGGNTLIPDTKISKTLNRWEARPKIAIDSDGDIHVIWQDEDENNIWQLYYTKIDRVGNTLIADKIITNRTTQGGWIEDISIILDLSDNLHIAWPDNRDSNFEIYYMKLDNSGNPLISDTRLTSYGGASFSPSIAVDSNKKVHIVWYDNRHGFSDIYYKYQNGWEAPPPEPELPEFNVAVILAEPSDVEHISSSITAQPCKLLPEKVYPNGHSKEYYQDLLYCVTDYHKENSFGRINLNFTIYDNNGGWFETDKDEEYYKPKTKGEIADKEREFAWDAIDTAENSGIDLSNKDITTVVKAREKVGLFSDFTGYNFIEVDDVTGEVTEFGKIIVGEKDPIGVWAHEIGHTIGVYITPENTATPDLYPKGDNKGNVKKWDLMADGAWNGGIYDIGDIPGDGTDPAYMSSFTKEFLGWLNYDIHPKSAYDEYWINSLATSNYGDSVFRYNLCDNTNDDCSKYYILEARNKTLKTWDTSLPGLPVTGDKNLVLYYVDRFNYLDNKIFPKYGYDLEMGKMMVENWIVTIPNGIINDGVLNPLINETYRDLDNLVKFSAITDRSINDKYEIQSRIEEITNDSFGDKFWGVILRPKSSLKDRIKGIFHLESPLRYQIASLELGFVVLESEKENTISIAIGDDWDYSMKLGLFLGIKYLSFSLFILLTLISILCLVLEKKSIPKWKSDKRKKIFKVIFRIIWMFTLIIFLVFITFSLITRYWESKKPAIKDLENSKTIANPSSIEPTTLPDLDLHVYCGDDRHVGINYNTGEYEIQIPEAIVSGDNQNAPEWIFIPEDITGCHFVVSSYDNQKFLEENPEIAQEIGDATDSYEIYARYIDPETDIYTSTTISQEIEAGVQLEHLITGTDDIIINSGEVTIDSIIGEIYQYFNLGWIDEVGVKESLLSKLNSAKTKIKVNQGQVAINILNAFINEVEAQRDRQIKINATEILIKNTKELIGRL